MNPYNIEEFIKSNTDLVKNLVLNKDKIHEKWTKYLDNLFSKLDDNISEIISLQMEIEYMIFCREHISFDSPENFKRFLDYEAYKSLSSIKDKIKFKPKSKIIDKVYDYETNSVYYLLEDGNLVKINESVTQPKDKLDLSVFNEDIIKLIDISLYRDIKINSIT